MGELRLIREGKEAESNACPFCGDEEHTYLQCDRVRRIEFEAGYWPDFSCVQSVEFWPPMEYEFEIPDEESDAETSVDS